MSDVMLECRDVSIRYMTGDFKNIGLKEWVVRRLTGKYRVSEFWADRHVSFTLNRGDMLGIIGMNGAGKSTILKAIAGIMEPTEGRVTRRGKVSALLELASGFDGDLDVKENAYLRGAMLGYTRAFMDATYGKIVEFAGLKEFEDRPFKQLSSGMKSRLAFAIASFVQPEILIIDEVLSVGDGAFREKSAAKMREIITGGATTILVSHSLGQIRSLCNKILWLHRGRAVAFTDDVEGVCDVYEEFLRSGGRPVFDPVVARSRIGACRADAGKEVPGPATPECDGYHEDPELASKISSRSGSGELRFVGFSLRGEDGQDVTCALQGERLRLVAFVKARAAVPAGTAYAISFNTKNDPGLAVMCSLESGVVLPALKPGERLAIETEFVSPFKKRRIALNFSLKPDQHRGSYYDHVYTGVTYDSVLRPEDEGKDVGGVFRLPPLKMGYRICK